MKDDAEAEDVAQETYLLIWCNAKRFRGDTRLAPWSRVRSHSRRARRTDLENQPERSTI